MYNKFSEVKSYLKEAILSLKRQLLIIWYVLIWLPDDAGREVYRFFLTEYPKKIVSMVTLVCFIISTFGSTGYSISQEDLLKAKKERETQQ